MSSSFETNPVPLRDLLGMIHGRRLALPDFQRDFVWEPPAIASLLSSLAANYPAGSLLTIRCGADYLFEERAFEGAKPLDGARPEELVLDGQQRLTSLFGALGGGQQHRFFLDVGRLLEQEPFEECIFYRPRDAQKGLDDVAEQVRLRVFPLDQLYAPGGFLGWATAIVEKGGQLDLLTKLHAVYDPRSEDSGSTIRNIDNYSFPVVRLPASTPPEAVCRIFSTINSTGVRLTTFDLLAAKLWPKNIRLRTWWRNARDDRPIIDEFLGADGYALLQAIAVRSGTTCTEGQILKLDDKAFSDYWESVVASVAGVLNFLRDECGVLVPKYLPARPALVTMAVVWPLIEQAKGPERGTRREKIKRWFWCASFGGRYDAGANNRIVQDTKTLSRWLDGGPVPPVVASFDFEPTVLAEVRPNWSLYRATMAMILKDRPIDFHTKSPTTVLRFQEGVDDHHIFPKKCSAITDGDDGRIHSVLNRVLIDASTNRSISNRNPSVYLGEMAEAVGGAEKLMQILGSHLLPFEDGNPLAGDDFDAFLLWRQRAVTSKVQALTGWNPDARRQADELTVRVKDIVEGIGATCVEESDSESRFYGFDVYPDGWEDEPLLWFGRWDNARAEHDPSGWVWVQWHHGAEWSDDGKAAWQTLVSAIGSDADYEQDGDPVAPVLLDDATTVAEALISFAQAEVWNDDDDENGEA